MPSINQPVPIDGKKLDEVIEACAKAIIVKATAEPHACGITEHATKWGIREGISIGLHLHGRALASAGPMPNLFHNPGPQGAAIYLLNNPLLTFPRDTER